MRWVAIFDNNDGLDTVRKEHAAAPQHPRRGIITGRDVLIVVARHAAEHWGEAQLTPSLMKARGDSALAKDL